MIKQLKKIIFSRTSMGLMAIAGIVLALYFGLVYERKPEIRYEITSNTSVLDIHEKLGKLDILYGGASLKKRNQGLRIITFRVSNVGTSDIPKGAYDENSPLGFALTEGEILEKPELIIVNNDYLLKNLIITARGPKLATFSPVIFASSEYFDVKVLVLTSENQTPTILPVGKVAGVRKIEVVEASKDKKTVKEVIVDFFTKTALVLFSVFFVAIVFAIITIPIGIYTEWRDKKKRTDLVKEFITTTNISDKIPSVSHVTNSYIESENQLRHLMYFMKEVDDIRAYISKPEAIKLPELLNMDFDSQIGEDLEKIDCLKINGYEIEIADEFRQALNEFVNFLKNKNIDLLKDRRQKS